MKEEEKNSPMPLYTPVNTVMLTEIPARPQQEVLFLPIHQSHALPWTGPNKSSQIQTEADQSQLFHLGKSDLKWCHFLRKYRSCTCLVVKKKKKKAIMCSGFLCCWSTSVVMQKCRLVDHLSVLWRRQPALEPFRIVQTPWKAAEMLKEPEQLQ